MKQAAADVYSKYNFLDQKGNAVVFTRFYIYKATLRKHELLLAAAVVLLTLNSIRFPPLRLSSFILFGIALDRKHTPLIINQADSLFALVTH